MEPVNENVTLNIGDYEIEFDGDIDCVNDYLNNLTPKNKVQSAFNLLMSTVAEKHKQQLKDLLFKDGTKLKGYLVVTVAGVLLEEVGGGIEVTVKKQKK